MVFFNCSKKPPCSCFQPCSTTSCNASLPLSDDMGCLLSARLGRAVGRHPLSFYPHFQQEILQTVALGVGSVFGWGVDQVLRDQVVIIAVVNSYFVVKIWF